MRTYNYVMSGTAARSQTWEAAGSIELAPGDFGLAFNEAMRSAFGKLTKGEAVFGQPGVGCSGPYQIMRFSLTAEEVTHE
jgi:hypothetical protein